MKRAWIGLTAAVVAGMLGVARAADDGADGAAGKRAGRGAKMLEHKFSEMDKNGDGTLSKDEFPRPERFDTVDADHDGKVTKEEIAAAFKAHVKDRVQGAAHGVISARFKQIDADSDGKVSKTEFEAVFAKLDANGDGFVTEDEIKARFAGREGGGKKEAKTEKTQ